jgi:hypothetical protein
MEWLALVMPLMIALGALTIWGKKLTWFEVVIPIVVTAIIIMSCKYLMVKSNVKDTEYLSSHFIQVKYYEPWDEYIHKTCSYVTCSGGKVKTCVTHYYDCSYVKYHPAEWVAILANGNSVSISQEKYRKVVALWGYEYYMELNRHYYSIDGNAYASNWKKNYKTLVPYDWTESYDNRPQAAVTVFNFKPLDSTELKQVVDYPPVIENKQKVCIKCVEKDNKELSKMNSVFGPAKHVKIFVILFKNKPLSAATLQKRYWKGGNKNELVICADVDSKWCQSFSWSDDKRLEANANQIFMDQSLTVNQKLNKLRDIVPKLWERKQFKDFEYIDVELSTKQLVWIHLISIFITIGLIIWGVKNDLDQE